MAKIYDCFTFYNELDLLDLRFEELYNHVDYFVLVESDSTFTNAEKPYYFEENKGRYSQYLDKVIHIKINSLKHSNAWQNEYDQRNSIMLGTESADINDIIMISDVDEIVRPEVIQRIRNSNADIHALYLTYFYFKLNYMSSIHALYDPIVIAARKHIVAGQSPQHLRHITFSTDTFKKPPYQYEHFNCQLHNHAGWHFTYMGDTEFIKRKFLSFSHAPEQSLDNVERYNVADELYENDARFFVKIDDYFPVSLRNNLAKYQKFFGPSGKRSARQIINTLILKDRQKYK